ncbi:hypothetical protein M0812_30279 [Anaeramoeba flamelloides]|uniref:Stealth protein CR2 conserved region 2 domain-containing protein n=1 Tax=Anaeramoeba flamelloides TaxID=1746091 RepID=A0AAV7Y6F8_9EUKA|nr:hypothetical protein M0812_30279 [Anaeramoeba flamelloides]
MGDTFQKQRNHSKTELFNSSDVEKRSQRIKSKEFELQKTEFAIEKLEFAIERKKKKNEDLDLENEKDRLEYERSKIEIEKLELEREQATKEKKTQEEDLAKEKRDYNIIKEIVTDEGKIDVVYTWAGIIKTLNTRNRYNYELQFSLRSVHKYLPWANNIYILMNPDKDYPYWIKEHEPGKIIVYDRCKLIDNPDHCPTGNNFAVFAGIHKIEGLTNKFLLFDDDMFINQPLKPEYFFTRKDLPRVFQKRKRMKIYKNNTEYTDIKRPTHKFALYTHIPSPMRRDFIVKFHQDYPEYEALVQSHYKRRYKALSEEFAMIYYEYFLENNWLQHEKFSKGKFYQIPGKHRPDITKQFNRIYNDLTTKNINSFNCNDNFSTDLETYNNQKKVLLDFYMKLYPETPDYEIPNPVTE